MSFIKLYNDDCINLFKSIEDESIDLIVTDPPYKLTSRGNNGTSGGIMKKDIYMKGDVFSNNDIKPTDYAPHFYRLLKDGSHCYVMCNNLNLQLMLISFEQVGFHFVKSIIWDKQTKIMGTHYMSQYEHILMFSKGYCRIINNCGTSDILSIKQIKQKDLSGNNIHDTEKPVELMRVLVENSSNYGDVVVDPFMGIGSVGCACKQTGRSFIGCEIDKSYFSFCKNRIDNFGTSITKKSNKLF